MAEATASAQRPGRPASMLPAEAGTTRRGGWIAPCGEFYPCARWEHVQVAAELRASGSGPVDPWDMRDGWCMVKADGELLALPHRLSQPQLDALGDILLGAPESPYRSSLL